MFANLSYAAVSVLLMAQAPQGDAPVDAPGAETSETRSWAEIEERVTRFVDASMDELGVVPGLAVAVVTPQGRYARGFGVADIRTGRTVDADTAFYIASTTKSFTGLAMNILHNRGDIDLDQSLAAYAPDAPFPAAIDAGTVRLRDLLTHTHGIAHFPFGYRLAYSGEHDPDTLWNILALSQASEEAPLGQFEYTNVGYNMLTLFTDRQTGTHWQDILQREVYDRAGFTRTSSRLSDAERFGWELAMPHRSTHPDGVQALPLSKSDATLHSAGGTIMSARDAARWLEILTTDGMVDGERVFAARDIMQTRERLIEVGTVFAGMYGREHYGLGWYIGSYRDETMVHHFGAFTGARAHISYLPDRDVGVAVFTNDDTASFYLTDVIANYVYDLVLGDEQALERAERMVQQLVGDRERELARFVEREQERNNTPWQLSLPPEAYVGVYRSQALGTMVVSCEDGQFFVNTGHENPAPAQAHTAPEGIRFEILPYRTVSTQFVLNDAGDAVTGFRFRDEFLHRQAD